EQLFGHGQRLTASPALSAQAFFIGCAMMERPVSRVYALARSAFATKALPNDHTAPGTRSLSARTAANAFRMALQSASEMTREGSSLIVSGYANANDDLKSNIQVSVVHCRTSARVRQKKIGVADYARSTGIIRRKLI